jgi:hypothetical protein
MISLRSSIFAAFAALCVISSAHAQSPNPVQSETRDVVLEGVHFRIPVAYQNPKIWVQLFSFWVSDGKPIWSGISEVPSAMLVGKGVFWPPEPRRPFDTDRDFFVKVLEVQPEGPDDGMARQQRMRNLITGIGPEKNQYGLECRTALFGKGCMTAMEGDVVMNMIDDNLYSWRMHFYSHSDGLSVELDIPLIGLPRWSQVICQTLVLLRTWRAAAGPAPSDCSKLPRLSMN